MNDVENTEMVRHPRWSDHHAPDQKEMVSADQADAAIAEAMAQMDEAAADAEADADEASEERQVF